MELFLLYAMGLTIVAFFSIAMASPKVLPLAQHGSDNEHLISKPDQSTDSFNELDNESASNQDIPKEAANGPSSSINEDIQTGA